MNPINKEIFTKEVITTPIQRAIMVQQSGNLAEAETRCRSILAMDPENADALHLLGVIHHQTGRKKTAINLIGRAIHIKPTDPYFYNNLGSTFRSREKFDKAKQCFQKALRLKSNYPEALYNLAGIFHLEKRFNQALTCYQKALKLNDRFPEALNNMAATLNMVGKYDQAVDCCKQAIRIRPDYSEAYNNMGNAYKEIGRPDLALTCYEQSMTLSGKSVEVLTNLANVLQEMGQIEQAISIYENAIQLNPVYGMAYNNLGTAYRAKRNLAAAERQFKHSIKLAPKDAQGYHNLGNVCYDRGDLGAAASWYEKALSINSESVPTYINRGIIYQETGQSTDALECFDRALVLDPNNSKAHSHLVHELYQRCDWNRIHALNAMIDQFTARELAKGQRPNEMPFLSLIRTTGPMLNFRVAQRWSQEISKSIVGNKGSIKFKHTRRTPKKITIGYISNNFRNHPTSHLIRNIFDLHDRTRFVINAYSYGVGDDSLYRENINRKCDIFVDLSSSTHEDAARLIYEDHVDILVDLVGYMRGNRLEICAYRPAPIQVRWLGLAGTTGC